MRRFPIAALAAAFVFVLAWHVSVRQAALFAIGVGMGAALAGARFGFTTGWRNLVVARDPRGVVGQAVLLGLAALGSMPLLAQSPVRFDLGPLLVPVAKTFTTPHPRLRAYGGI